MFYALSHDFHPKYGYIWSIRSFDRWILDTCPSCGRQRIVKADYQPSEPLMELEGPKKYPDFLQFCGVGIIPYPFILSERAMTILEENHISGVKRGKKVEFTAPPKGQEYVYLEISGRIDLHLKSMQLKRKHLCKECGQFDWSRKSLGRYILDRDSWNGADLCRLTSQPGHFICTEKVVELVKTHQLTGFFFEPLKEAPLP